MVREPRDRQTGPGVALSHDGVVLKVARWRRTKGPVILVGFSGGAVFAGGLILTDPARYLGAATLSGTLAFDADIPTSEGQLKGVEVFVSQGEQDALAPRSLLDRTWSYLVEKSGATTSTCRDQSGHSISKIVLAHLNERIDPLIAALGTELS